MQTPQPGHEYRDHNGDRLIVQHVEYPQVHTTRVTRIPTYSADTLVVGYFEKLERIR